MLFEDPNDILEQFNNYFQEIGQSIANSACHSANSTLKAYLSNPVLPAIFLEPTQPSEIYNIINTVSPQST